MIIRDLNNKLKSNNHAQYDHTNSIGDGQGNTYSKTWITRTIIDNHNNYTNKNVLTNNKKKNVRIRRH